MKQSKETFNDAIELIVSQQSAALGVAFNWIPSKLAPNVYPFVRSFFPVPGGRRLATYQNKQIVKVCVGVNIDGDDGLAYDMAAGILSDFEIDVAHERLMTTVPLINKDVSPAETIGFLEIWLHNPDIGFAEIPDPDPNVTVLACDFRLLYR